MNESPLMRISYKDKKEGFEGWLVIDSLHNGVCGGGLRVTKTVTLREVERLAAGMTRKNRTINLPLGGAKSAIQYDPRSPGLEDALVRFFEHVGPICSKFYGWGPDMNTPPDLCDRVATRAGFKSRHMALAEKSEYGYNGVENYNKALRLRYGPLSITDARTSVGVAGATETAAEILNFEKPLRVAIQGFGSVGMGTAYFLGRNGHKVVGVADAGGCYLNQDGFDFEQLHKSKIGNREIQPDKIPEKYHAGVPNNILFAECDVLILAAIPDALKPEDVPKIKCKLVVEGGNFAVDPKSHSLLEKEQISLVPDYVASGGAIAIVSGIIQLGWDIEPEILVSTIRNRVSEATRKFLEK